MSDQFRSQPDFDFEEHRRQWREVPTGYDRSSTTSLAELDDPSLHAFWQQRWDDQIESEDASFHFRLYGDFMRGKRVLELGSGLGFDGIYFTNCGADWTFCDIAQDNLDLVGRNFAMRCPGKPFHSHLIDSPASFDRLAGDYDVIWANGSLLTIPFDLARDECMHVLPLLKPGGRWIELTYPRERWEREGSPPFSQWGGMTDGPGKPWMEWYDLPKLLRRMKPARFKPLLAFNFVADTVNWFDLILDSREPLTLEKLNQSVIRSVPLPLTGRPFADATFDEASNGSGVALSAKVPLWNYIAAFPLASAVDLPLTGGVVSVEVECEVKKGTMGISVATESLGELVSNEVFLKPKVGVVQTAQLEPRRLDDLGYILVRNGGADDTECVIRSIRAERIDA